MAFQDSVGQIPVAEQFDGASEMLFQPFGGYFRIGMIIQRFVDARYGFYILQHSAYVMAYQDDGPFLVDFFQQGVEFWPQTVCQCRYWVRPE